LSVVVEKLPREVRTLIVPEALEVLTQKIAGGGTVEKNLSALPKYARKLLRSTFAQLVAVDYGLR
jgi:hypothetical protein